MKIYRLLSAAAAVSLLAGAAWAQAPAAPAAASPATPGATLAKPLVASGDTMATLRLNSQFTTLVKALDAANLSSLLQQRPNMTLFVPPDAAFAALPAGELDKMLADPEKKDLRKLLLHHLINAPVPASKIKGTRGPWPTGAGDKMVLDGSADGVLKADNATIIQPDVTTANGTIQVVDHVLIAGSVPETLPEAAAEPAPAPEPVAPAPAPKPAPRKKK